MKIVRFETGGTIRYGILEENSIIGLDGEPYDDINTSSMKFSLASSRLLAPCDPSKIVALGVNYRSHGEEMNSNLPDEPLIFLKPPSSVIGPDEAIVYPPSSQHVDYEGELGVVIKDVTSNVSREDALDHVLGYTCLNDVTARDLHSRDRQWTRGKGFDTFCPFEDLDQDLIFFDLKHLAVSQRTVAEFHIYNVSELSFVDLFNQHQRAVNTTDCLVFFKHFKLL